MTIKVKNYVIEERKTFTYTVKDLNIETLTYVFQKFLKCGCMFDFRKNAKSNTFSFCVLSLNEMQHFKNMFYVLVNHA